VQEEAERHFGMRSSTLAYAASLPWPIYPLDFAASN
jgi:hypothetical protein